ncbi:hypothetical protein BH23GEM9_BH23GEM9_00750 [soil metagenome]
MIRSGMGDRVRCTAFAACDRAVAATATFAKATAARATATTFTMTAAMTLGITVAAVAPVHAQAVMHPLLPDSAAIRVVAFYNLEPTTRLTGEARIGAGTAMRGGVAVLAGTLIIEGNVEGDVVVINGHLDVRPGGRVGGTATVVGGDVRMQTGGTIVGAVTVYREPLRYRYQGDRIAYIPQEMEAGLAAGFDLSFGRTDLLIATHGPYNRVEGLPIAVGPRIRFGGSHPTTARALLILRTAAASDLDPRRVGFDASAEQLVAPAHGLSLGVRLYSEIAPVESWGMTDGETALSTFLLHRDYRDYYEREGWSLYLRLARPGDPYTVQLAYRDEQHSARAAADPFTILDNNAPWRLQPRIAEGELRSISASSTYDTRNEPRDPSTGWLIHLGLERGLGGRLTNRTTLDPAGDTIPATAAPSGFLTTHIDVRRYARLSPYTRLGIRILGAGSLDARALPPQRQHALGGEGSLPAYALFQFDCGARNTTITLRDRPFHPYYGCDRLALVQLEYQANFPFARRLAEASGIGASVGNLVRWVAFFDAGRVWTEPAARNGRQGGDNDFSAGAGLGIRVGPAGIYWAVPLSGQGQDFNFFIRLGPRI